MDVSPSEIAVFRQFNRLHTQFAGVLTERLLDSPLSLTEARLLYEIAHRDAPAASDLVRDLGVDPGYVSRILRSFQKRGLIARGRSEADGRQRPIRLTAVGQALFAKLNASSDLQASALLSPIPAAERARLIGAMTEMTALIGRKGAAADEIVLRPHRVGDMGWIVYRQSRLYHEEHGWNAEYEALISEITAKFLRQFKPGKEYCWVAERGGEIVGSVFLVQDSETVARLRLLYVEPKARGAGLGRRMVEECIRFAHGAGYERLVLWTNDVLVSARNIYLACGFKLVSEEPHVNFGKRLTGQTWELELLQPSFD